MPTWPEVPAREEAPRSVGRVRRRLSLAQVLDGGTVGGAVGAVAAALARQGGWRPVSAALIAALVAGGVAISWFLGRRRSRTRQAAASAIERALPDSRNVVFTAVELTEHPERARPWIRERVLADAARVALAVEPRAIVPLRLEIASCVLAFAVAAGAILNVHQRAGVALRSAIQDAGGRVTAVNRRLTIVATLQPPPHTHLAQETLSQPDRIAAVEGTKVRLAVSGAGTVQRIRFGNVLLQARTEGGATVVDLTLRESGYLVVAGDSADRLIPVAVTPDRKPAITIERPGRDLLLPAARPSLAVEAAATDDFGLELLALRYTKVSGSGEQFEFVEGELPFAVARQNARFWRGRGELPLTRLGLEAGDSLVYRVIARDGRAGEAGLASSDTFFIEVAGPGLVAIEGFEMPPDRERYALSQHMIVLKIQRLRERERSLARGALQEQTGAIAAEQRAVRANFVFLMGGHVEDEEEEAEHSNEIQEGRLENTARREISRAVGHMSHAEQELVGIDTAGALKEAKLAVDALQRAFGRNRYVLRTLPVRSRIDPSRRLTGKLDEAKGWTRTPPEASRDARAQAIRDLLAQAIPVAGEIRNRSDKARSALALARLSEEALAIDPADREWQEISDKLTRLRDAVAGGAPKNTVDATLRDALQPLVAQARRAARPRGAEPGAGDPLRGAWAEETRRQ